MSDYLTAEQVTQLLRPINSTRVGKDPKGFSYLEQYDVRAHLNRLFGFARWSADLMSLDLIFEDVGGDDKKPRYTVGYRAVMRLVIKAPDGTNLATYTEAAVGGAQNQPSHADAHDLAIKTAESQALKRAAINLGDQFGLSLYGGGSKAALVKAVLVAGTGEAELVAPVDEGIEPVVPDAETPSTVEPTPETVSAVSDVDWRRDLGVAINAIPAKATPRAKQIALVKIKLDYKDHLHDQYDPKSIMSVNTHLDALIAEAKAEVAP